MALREEFEKQGDWLFRKRSYLPVIILPLLILAIKDESIIREHFGIVFSNVYELSCILISSLGLIIRAITIGFTPKGTSGRNTGNQRADELNTKGIYSVVRHPLYLGNFLMFFGVFLFMKTWWLVLIAVAYTWIYYERIMYREEEFLRGKFGDNYVKWSSTVPAIIPNFKNWQKSDLNFSLKNILKREYSGFLGIIMSFSLLKLTINYFDRGYLYLSKTWLLFLICGVSFALLLRTLKKKTKILHVTGR